MIEIVNNIFLGTSKIRDCNWRNPFSTFLTKLVSSTTARCRIMCLYHDGVPVYYSHVVCEFLKVPYMNRWIGWAQTIQWIDLNPIYYLYVDNLEKELI